MPNCIARAKPVQAAVWSSPPQSSTPRALRLAYTFDHREATANYVICEGETNGFETT